MKCVQTMIIHSLFMVRAGICQQIYQMKKAMQDNHAKMLNISFFNDEFREVMKGGSSDFVLVNKGFITGNLYETEHAKNVVSGLNRYSRPDQSINYVECHDNATIFDKLYISNVEEGLSGILNRQKNLTIMTLLAQGIPFIHAGQEFYRTKGEYIIHIILLII